MNRGLLGGVVGPSVRGTLGALVPADSSASTAANSKQLQEAGELIERELDHDESRDHLLDELTTNENGYYHFEKSTLQMRRQVPIPTTILEQYDHLECKSFVGLFPEIHRAFITIDNKLFLWNYYDGSDFYLYDELSQIIISVALLRPKPGVFVSTIQYILVLSTPVEILMFAIKFDGDNVHNSLHLFPTQFTIPSDNVHMTSIIGTEQGRIFLCGRDGGIYELDYWSGEDSGWFGSSAVGGRVGSSHSSSSGGGGGLTVPFTNFFFNQRKKCRKVNHSNSSFKLIRSILPVFLGGTPTSPSGEHGVVESIVYDSTRNFLFTLSNEATSRGGLKPVIACYELGVDGWEMKFRSKNDNILEGVRTACKSIPTDLYSDLVGGNSPSSPQVDLKIIHLSPIPVHESATIVLMAITSHGHRIYFDFDLRNHNRLRVKFVRLCPPGINPDELRGGSSSSTFGRIITKVEPRFAKGTSPSLVHSAYYKDGVLLLADAGRSSLGDALISIHKDPRPTNTLTYNARSTWGSSAATTLNEAIVSFEFEARIADVGEVHQQAALNLLSSALFARPGAANAYSMKYSPVMAGSTFQSIYGSSNSSARLKPLYGLPELATQHLVPNRQLLILTSNSLITMIKIRPLDELKQALSLKKRTNDESAILTFWQRYGAKEACAMCLIIIGANFVSSTTSTGAGELDEVEKKSQYGNGTTNTNGQYLSIASPNKLLGTTTSSSSSPSSTSLGGVSDEQLRKGAKQAFFRFGELHQESLASRATTASGSSGGLSALSAKLEGVALYLSRWLRAHWDWSLCISQPQSTTSGSIFDGTNHSLPILTFRFSQEFYLELLQPLVKLQRFLEDHQRVFIKESVHTLAAASGSTYGQSSGLADPARVEMEAFNNVSALLNLTIEIFHLLILFLTYTPTSTISNPSGSSDGLSGASSLLRTSPFLNSTDLQQLKDLKFSAILTTADGHALIRKMINTLAYVGAGSTSSLSSPMNIDHEMNGHGGQRSSNKRGRDENEADGWNGSNQLISQLRTTCPTFFGSTDLLYYNALDSLKLAKQHWNLVHDRTRHIQQALQTYYSFIESASFPLEDIADKLKGVYEYSGIVELAMKRAELLDRHEIAKPKIGSLGSTASGGSGLGSTMIGGSIVPTNQGAHLSDAEYYSYQRKRCFNVILDTMNILMFGVSAGKSMTSNESASSSRSANESRGLNSTTVTIDSTIPPLSSEQLSAMRDRVLTQLLSSNDMELHATLYNWYIEKNRLDDLYSIQSDYLIRFLTSSEKHILILKDYYLRNEKYHEAALLLNYLSLKKTDEYTLKDRSDFLTRALHCARNFQQQLQKHGVTSPVGVGGRSKRVGQHQALQTSIAEQQDLIDQLKDRIEIAKIQMDIYDKLQLLLQQTDDELHRLESTEKSASRDADLKQCHDKHESLESALRELDSSLLDLQQLYLFCANFGLWECCLKIFKFSNESQRPEVICALWKNIFRSEMAGCKKLGKDWGDSVKHKFIELSSDPSTNYREIDFMFPLEFLIRELEVNNWKYRGQPEEDYVSMTLLEAGIPPHRLLQQYDRMLENWEQEEGPETSQTNARGQTIQPFLYASIWHLLRTIIQQESASHRRPFGGLSSSNPTPSLSSSASAAALNLFNKCLTNLRTLPPSETTNRLVRQFQQLYEQFKAQR